jgi:DNA-binding transcriptional regulator YbjK
MHHMHELQDELQMDETESSVVLKDVPDSPILTECDRILQIYENYQKKSRTGFLVIYSAHVDKSDSFTLYNHFKHLHKLRQIYDQVISDKRTMAATESEIKQVVDQTTKLMDKMFDDYLKKQKQTFFRYK